MKVLMLVLNMSRVQHYESGYFSIGCPGEPGEIARAGLRFTSTGMFIGSGAQFVVGGGIADAHLGSELWAWKSTGWGGA